MSAFVSEGVKVARNRLQDALWEALESFLTRWAQANGVTFDKRALEQAIEKLLEGQ